MPGYFLLALLITLNPLFTFLFANNAYAQTSVTVTAGVGDTILTLSGKTSPDSQVTFLRGGTVIGTTVSDINGDFYKQFTSQAYLPEIHDLRIYSTDSEGISTSTILHQIYVPPHTETHWANIVLPPTINISTTTIDKEINEILNISGHTVPLSAVTVFFYYSTISKSTTSDESGYWEVFVEAVELETRTHLIYAKTLTESGHLSPNSEQKIFLVTEPAPIPEDPLDPTDPDAPRRRITDTATTDTTITATEPEEEIEMCKLPSFLQIFDFNNDCFVDLIEFTSAIKTWFGFWNNQDIDKCDVNKDGRCDLRDFSILLYYTYR
jgi:hypothetical protein